LTPIFCAALPAWSAASAEDFATSKIAAPTAATAPPAMAMPSTSFLIASPTPFSVAPSASPAEPMPLKLGCR
jgi:hypothetical protein